jgi:hypothetical protein
MPFETGVSVNKKLSLHFGLMVCQMKNSSQIDDGFLRVLDALIYLCVNGGVLVECNPSGHGTWQIFQKGDRVLPDGYGFDRVEYCYFAWVGSGCRDDWIIARVFDPKSTGISLVESEDFTSLFSEVIKGRAGSGSVFSSKHNVLVCLDKVVKA